MQEFIHTQSILDVVSSLNRHDIAYVLPTLDHAFWWWRIVRTAVLEAHGKDCAVPSKTAVVTRCNHRAVRLWVPYSRDPTMPMDFSHKFKYLCDYVSPHFSREELIRLGRS